MNNKSKNTARAGSCPDCDNPTCTGEQNILREYTGYTDPAGCSVSAWAELTLHCDEAQIIRWVNELALIKERQRFYHERNRKRRQLLERAARELLDPDELRRISELAAKRAAGILEGEEEKKDGNS